MRNALDIQTARRDIGRDQHIRRAVAEAAQDAVALFLRQSAVQRFGAIASGAEGLGKFVDLDTRPAKNDRRRFIFHIQYARERRRFLTTLNDVGDFADARRFAGRDRLARDRYAHRVVQMAFGDLEDATRHRRGEERRLAHGRNRR